jgi:K+-sensing histidine kinase KdpD
MHRLTKYVVAVGLVGIALALKYPFESLGADHPFLLLPAAVIVATWYGGRGPGVTATILAAVAADVLFLPPFGLGTDAGEIIALAVLLAEGFLIVSITVALRRARERAAGEAAAADQARREAALALRMREELIDLWTRKARGPISELAASLWEARDALRDHDHPRTTAALARIEADLGLLERTTEHWDLRDEEIPSPSPREIDGLTTTPRGP